MVEYIPSSMLEILDDPRVYFIQNDGVILTGIIQRMLYTPIEISKDKYYLKMWISANIDLDDEYNGTGSKKIEPISIKFNENQFGIVAFLTKEDASKEYKRLLKGGLINGKGESSD